MKLGFFLQFGYVWVFIDSLFFFWDYMYFMLEFIGYEELIIIIIVVVFVVLKLGVFVKIIIYIFVIFIIIDVVFVGVVVEINVLGVKKVMFYQIKMVVYCGGSDVSYIVGIVNGCIFVGGEMDIDIYEIVYQ